MILETALLFIGIPILTTRRVTITTNVNSVIILCRHLDPFLCVLLNLPTNHMSQVFLLFYSTDEESKFVDILIICPRKRQN